MNWFESLTGFQETSPAAVREQITVAGERLTSLVNQRSFVCGRLETPSLAELRERVLGNYPRSGRLRLWEVVGDVQKLHTDVANAGAFFQVASQFNLLEMVDPQVTPEHGVGIYENDPTQGPACAIAAGAGTIFRNYFATVDGQTGQSATHQIDCLRDLGQRLGNADHSLWQMRNGYALPTKEGLQQIAYRLQSCDETALDRLRQTLRIGVHWNTQVTLRDSQHTVTQAFCSALPVAYTRHPVSLWQTFARLVLEASYEAALGAAILNARETGNRTVYLTLLGGGAFGNPLDWITDSLERALRIYADAELDVAVVSYRDSNPVIRQLAEKFSGAR